MLNYNDFLKYQSYKYSKAMKDMRKYINSHGYHLVSPSPWPFCTALAIFGLTVTFLLIFQEIQPLGKINFFLSIVYLIVCLQGWFRDIIIEATYQGQHTRDVQQGLRYGFILFIVSEIMFFFGFFWAFFHVSLSPSIEIGGIWPPKGIHVFNYYEIPLLNTLILLVSGATITYAHKAFFIGSDTIEKYKYAPLLGLGYDFEDLVDRNEKDFSTVLTNFFSRISFANSENILIPDKGFMLMEGASIARKFIVLNKFFYYHSESRVEIAKGLILTILLGIFFTIIQLYEYINAPFSISDGIYGSIFFLTTGFHGLHVLVGTIFLIVTFYRHYNYHFTREHHFGFEAAAWYWHFVDIVWLFLYISIYCWGS